MNNYSNGKVSPENFGYSFLNEEPVKIYNQCINEFKKIISLDQFTEMILNFNQDVESFHLQKVSNLGKHTHYLWLDKTKEKAVSVYFDTEDYIHRIMIKPYITFRESDSRLSKISYSMPINEEWLVFWGGKNEFINYHYIYETQRYAYDLLIMKNGDSFINNQMRNENYFASADGEIIKVINNIKDNIPGEMNDSEVAGNYIITQHSDNEYSLLAHFKESSIMVSEGDLVEQGQLLGYCGNSGNSSEPHIHFQVMDYPDINKCNSISIRFVDKTEPVQGDIVTQISDECKETYNKKRLDKTDKVEIAFSLTDFLLIIPRFIGQLFK